MTIRIHFIGLLLFGLGSATAAQAASFVVLDQKATEEISEVTRLYVDGALVASAHLDNTTLEARMPVMVADRPGPDGQQHDYALCGEIVFRAADGTRAVHQVNGQGVLVDPDGRNFMALGARDFTRFYLADPTDRMAVRPQPGPSPFCQTPIS
jgi:hypothetical protein